MGVQQRKVFVHDLQIGMFVSDLDRPWHQTPFPIQGFYIRSDEDIRALKSHCKWVAVDVAEARQSAQQETIKPLFGKVKPASDLGRQEIKLPPLNIKDPVVYESTVSFRKELKVSQKLLVDLDETMNGLLRDVAERRTPDFKGLAAVTQKVVSSVVRNPDAVLWLTRTRRHDDFTYQHSLNTAVWALVCGRELGLNEGLLNHLGMGCLLSQVGKLFLPEEVLENEGKLDSESFAVYRTYVQKGVDCLTDTGVSRAVLSVVQGHRERHNGSGFPEGIRGDRIPLLAKVAGLAEYFESLVGPRYPADPLTPAKAVSLLYELRNIEFQEDLVEKFISAVGIYPAGSLVELNGGQRGVVVSHSAERRLWPKVMVMTDETKKPLRTAKIIDLAKYNEGRLSSDAMSISECLPAGTEGLDPAMYDVTGAETRWALAQMIKG